MVTKMTMSGLKGSSESCGSPESHVARSKIRNSRDFSDGKPEAIALLDGVSKRKEGLPMSLKRKTKKRPNSAKRPKDEKRRREDEDENEPDNIWECLENFGLDFDCAVAVWLHGLREMSNEVVQFLNLKAMDYCCVSRCFKFSLRTKRVGAIFLFEDKVRAAEFCAPLRDAPSPHGDYPFRAERLGNHLRIVADIEQQQGQTGGEVSIVIRNLSPLSKVTKRVAQLCSIFGQVRRFEVFQDVGEHFEFRHVLVSYKYAVQAFAAKLALDGKWIAEQGHPLAVEVLPTDKVKAIYNELLKRNKMLFTP